MKKKLLLLIATVFVAGNCFAQIGVDVDEGVYVDLLPEGVKANVKYEKKQDKEKNIIVAGSPEKGYYAFFAASDEEHGEELWVTDGTKEGTRMVMDIVPGPESSEPSYLGRLNDKVLFSAVTEGYGRETWISDGTEEGTFMLVETNLFGDGDPKGFIQMNETQAVFVAYDDDSYNYDADANVHQQWLWVTDGTEEGTHRVVSDPDAPNQPNCKFPGQDNTNQYTTYVRVGRRVFFKADQTDNMTGEELWVTDGTEEGTYLVMDINWEAGAKPGQTRNCGLDNLMNYYNEKCFFQAWTPDFGGEPWVTDGTKGEAVQQGGQGDEHTYMVYDTRPGKDNNGIGFHAGTYAASVEPYGDYMMWRGFDPRYGYEFSFSNMEKGNYTCLDINKWEPSVDHNSYPDQGAVFDGVYIFCATTQHDATRPDCHGGELWCFDGEKVWEQSDLVPGPASNWVKEPMVAGGSLYWFNETNGEYDLGFGNGLYRLDSKDEKPIVCNRITSDPRGDNVHTLRNLNGSPIFASATTNRVYVYNYTKPGWDGESDKGRMEPEFRTRAEIAGGGTIVEKIETSETVDANVYTVGGTKAADSVKDLKKLPKGVYVVAGKKYVVK